MIRIEIPGRETYEIEHVVLDYNGTAAVDGEADPGGQRPDRTAERNGEDPRADSRHIRHSKGAVREPGDRCDDLSKRGGSCLQSRDRKRSSGEAWACFGNGFNDIPMFDLADLSIAVLEREGMCAALLTHATVIVRSFFRWIGSPFKT